MLRWRGEWEGVTKLYFIYLCDQSNVDVDITDQFTVKIVPQLSGKFEGSS